MAEKKPFGWIGVDFDGTLAKHDKWMGPDHAGDPIQPMIDRVLEWRKEGREVRIFTARIYPILWVPVDGPSCEWQLPDTGLALSAERLKNANIAARFLREWCRRHFGEVLPLTCVKDYAMMELWDDRCTQVEKNTGRVLDLPADWGYRS